jgi:quercetin dioxygenase-like cupin family protein
METTTNAIAGALVLPAQAIAALPEVPLDRSVAGVTHRVLWRNDTSMAGVMTVVAAHRLGRHAHRYHHHHLWVLEGEAEILGQRVGEGGYVHVPEGVEHDVDARATAGCTVFYLYLRPPS